MKKILKKIGVEVSKTNYFEARTKTPSHQRKQVTIDEVHKMIRETRAQKVKRAS